MNKKPWIIAFTIAWLADLIGIQWQLLQLEYIFKPLLIPLLIGYFFSSTKNNKGALRNWIILALFFSWMGDILLMFQVRDEMFFLAGLSAFLLAHIFYIVYFYKLWMRENIKRNPWILLVVVVYYATLVSWLSPYLGDKKLPVRIYGIAISFMVLLASHMLFIKNRKAGVWMMTGALLFVISDSLLAINKFYQSFELAGIAVMITYGLAQLFIVEGAIRYIRSINSN